MLQPGSLLRHRYRIEAPIGQGGMGSVYLAEDVRLEGRKCAVKAVRIDPSIDPALITELQLQFSREASVLARLDHPNLPKVSDYFTEDGSDYLVMDYVSGKNLKELMDEARRAGRFLTEVEVTWARQLCDALEYLHTQDPPVLHRDIKPSNIKLAPSGLVKLVDFGLVKLLSKDTSQTVTVLQGRGTAAYTPLEQYGEDDSHTDTRSDIYALGATLYHLLTNTPPADARQRFLNPGALGAPRQLNADLSETACERAMMSAISMHPDDRPSTVNEFRELLFSTDTLPSGARKARRQPREILMDAIRENQPWLIAAAIAAAAGLAVTIAR